MTHIHQKRVRHTRFANDGYVVLLTVLSIGAVAVAIATTLLMFGVDAAKNALTEDHGKQARGMADACAEEALEQIREASTFTGYNTLMLGTNVCSYNVTNLGGQNREVRASSTVSTTVRRVKITLDRVRPTLNVTSWQEVINF